MIGESAREARGSAPSLAAFLAIWLSLGAQSFGGGTATLALIRREVVERRQWMEDAEFLRDWALCQIAPGINLLAITILIGRRVFGAFGIVLALFGLLFPSVAITIILTAFYAHFRNMPQVRSAVHAVIPATVGVGLVTGFKMVWPLLVSSWREGAVPIFIAVGILGGSALAILFGNLPVVVVLLTAGAIGAVFQWAFVSRRDKTGRQS